MPEIIVPDFDSIYTQEYWGDIPPMMNFDHKGTFGRSIETHRRHDFHHGRVGGYDIEQHIGEAVGRSMLQIYAGELTEPILDGELIGGKDDTKYALPGNILLLDNEEIWFREHTYDKSSNAVQNEFELSASAIRLFKSKMKRELSFESQAFPGVSGIPKTIAAGLGLTDETHTHVRDDPLFKSDEYVGNHTQDGVAMYTRTVSLVTFFVDKKGKVGSRRAYHSGVWDSGGAHSHLGTAIPHIASRVGETVNLSVNTGVTNLSRTRSAYMCARGAFEYATAPVKARRHILFGKFATSRA